MAEEVDMAAPQSPIGSRRRLGAELRRLRNEAGLTLDEVAEQMTCSTSKISRLETGKGIPKVPDVRELMRIYGVDVRRPSSDELLRLVRDGREHGWWEPLTEGVAAGALRDGRPEPLRRAGERCDRGRGPFDIDRACTGCCRPRTTRGPSWRALLPHHPATRSTAGRAAAASARRRCAGADPRRCALVAVMDEAVLRRPVGGPAVMAGAAASGSWTGRRPPNVDHPGAALRRRHPSARTPGISWCWRFPRDARLRRRLHRGSCRRELPRRTSPMWTCIGRSMRRLRAGTVAADPAPRGLLEHRRPAGSDRRRAVRST